MADDPRSYLLDRFSADAATLRARAAQLAGKPAPTHGPNAAASERMAEACDHVLALLGDLGDSVAAQLAALDAVLPQLAALAERAPDAFVRSVYGGAATRIAEIVSKERAANDGDADDFDDAFDDDAEDDDLVEDDEDVREDDTDDYVTDARHDDQTR
jgi:hypothetical protein